MKRCIRVLLGISFLLAFSLLTIRMAIAVDKVVFVGAVPLYLEQPRLIIALLTEAFGRNGIKFTAQHLPPKRCLLLSNSGQVDGELHRVYNFHEVTYDQYSNLIRIESTMLSIYWAAYFKRKDIKLTSWDDVKKYTIAHMRGIVYVKDKLATLLLPKDRIHMTDSGRDGFKMVTAGKADITIGVKRDMDRIILRDKELSRERFKSVIIEKILVHSFMNKKHQKLAETIADTLEEMKKDGTYQRIVDEVSEQ